MSDTQPNGDRNSNIWAPWRMEYIDSLDTDSGIGDGCFLCSHAGDTEADAANHILWRGKRCMAMLNRFPYTAGHSMVAPYEHIAAPSDLDDETMLEMMRMTADLQKLLAMAVRAEGFNIGMNLGRCAGAGLPGHLHIHIVPRWAGDTNFMPVLGKVRVIPQMLDEMYELLGKAAAELDLPRQLS